MMTGLGSACGACKFLRRKCNNGCVFAPYFCYDQGATHFAAVHKVFGASNASKLLWHLPVHNRREAAITISYEALARMGDPVYGCVAHIFALQQQVVNLKEEIEFLETQVANRAIDVVSDQRPHQEMNDTDMGFHQFPSPEDGLNIYDYCNNQQAPDPSHVMNATGNLGPCNEINYLQFPPQYRWGDHTLFFNSINESSSSERIHIGMDQELPSNYPWLDFVADTEN